MRLIFHGELRKRFGVSFEMQVDSVASALEGFSRQTDWPKDMPVDVIGFDSHEKLQEYADEVHIVPAMQGGGGKFFNIIIGAVVVVAGILLMSVNPALGVSLIVSGSMMILQGVVMLFMKSPKLGKNQDPEASKYLPINRNTVAVGTPITLAWGRIDLAGHWLSLQSDSNNMSAGVFPTNPT